MYKELEESLENPKSVIRRLLQNCPESVESLLDDCLMSSIDPRSDNQGRVTFNFFLFRPESSETSEVAPIDLVNATGKKKLLVHPLFETFICLKWLKTRKLFTVNFLIIVMHMIALVGYSLLCFSPSFENVDKMWKKCIFWSFFLASNIATTLLQLAEIYNIFFWRFQQSRPRRSHALSEWVERRERLYPVMDNTLPIGGFIFLFCESRELAAFLILYSSWQCMRTFSMFPRIGKNVFITSKVTRTILEFFLSYMIEFLAFTISFHILLPHTKIFRYIYYTYSGCS